MKIKYIIVTVFIIVCGVYLNVFGTNNVQTFQESIETIRNPERGFYKLVQVELSTHEENIEDFEEEIQNIENEDTDVSIISFQLNLKNYVENTEIDNKKLKEIQKYFDIMRNHGYKVIFRVVYDSQGRKNPEPEFEKILEHIDILKKIYKDNEDILFLIEAGYLGSYGEWHDGKYDENKTYRNQVIKKLLEVVPSSITINLRKPSFIHDFTTEELNADNAFSKSDIARLGLHNDGYLASETDYGTFDIEEREESIEYQHSITKYIAFGGECTKKESEFNDFENAIRDMQYRHCTYLNKTYDKEVKEKWRQSTYYSDSDIYSKQNGFKYIQDHLGYRLVLREVDLKQENNMQKINIQLENIGFGNIINSKDVEIIYKNENEIYTSKIETDIRKDLIKEENILNLNYTIKLPETIKAGEYEVYLKISEPYESLKNNTKYCIQFANNNVWNENLGANFIGRITIRDENLLEADDIIISNSNRVSKNTVLKISLIIIIVLITIILIRKILDKK